MNTSALDARHRISSVLGAWAGFVAEGTGDAVPEHVIPQLTNYLLRHLEWLAGRPESVDFAADVGDLRRELLRTVDPDPRESPDPAWDCVVAGCPGKIHAPSRRVGDPDGRSIRCSSGHTWEVHEWITLRPLVDRQGKVVSA